MFGKRSITFLLVLSIVSSTFYLPVFAPRAQAIFGVGDINLESIPTVVKFILEKVGTAIAQKMIDDIVRSTVDWAQTGFEGNPAYVTDPRQYFTDIADGVAGDFIGGSDLGFLCSPFQTQIRLALQKQYTRAPQFQCTLTRVVGNIDGFYNDFSQGGWDGWFSMTQNSANNPYGAYLEAKIELDSRIAKRLGLEKQQLDRNSGFLSWADCIDYELLGFNPDGSPINGRCEERGPTQTPGSTIKSQLDEVLPSGLEKLIKAESLDQLVSAFASGLLQRYVFGSKGLFADNGSVNASGREIIDIDNDGIPDGWDQNRDGQLDICHHGLKPNLPAGSQPNNNNCLGSASVSTSPYFIPLCQALTDAIQELEKYNEFITRNDFEEVYSNTWMNRTATAGGAVDDLIQAIARYEIMEFDVALFELGIYADELGKRTESLAKDKDLDTLWESDEEAIERLRDNTDKILEYLHDFQTEMKRCDNPDVEAVGAIPQDRKSVV